MIPTPGILACGPTPNGMRRCARCLSWCPTRRATYSRTTVISWRAMVTKLYMTILFYSLRWGVLDVGTTGCFCNPFATADLHICFCLTLIGGQRRKRAHLQMTTHSSSPTCSAPTYLKRFQPTPNMYCSVG